MNKVFVIGLCCFVGVLTGCKKTKSHDEVDANNVHLAFHAEYNSFNIGVESIGRMDVKIQLVDKTDDNVHVIVNKKGIFTATIDGVTYDLSEKTHCGYSVHDDYCFIIDSPVGHEHRDVSIVYNINGTAMRSTFTLPELIVPKTALNTDYDPSYDRLYFEWKQQSAGQVVFTENKGDGCDTEFYQFENATSATFEAGTMCNDSRLRFEFNEVSVENTATGFSGVGVTNKQNYTIDFKNFVEHWK